MIKKLKIILKLILKIIKNKFNLVISYVSVDSIWIRRNKNHPILLTDNSSIFPLDIKLGKYLNFDSSKSLQFSYIWTLCVMSKRGPKCGPFPKITLPSSQFKKINEASWFPSTGGNSIWVDVNFNTDLK